MTKLITLLLLIISINCFATDYYVSNAGNDAANGLSPSTAWQSINKANGFTFAANDRILFNRGNSFFGSLVINRNNITVANYGTGNLPIITGFATCGAFGNNIAGVWQVNTTAKSTLNNVTVNGVQVAIGRFPNNDYLNFESRGTLTITDNQLSGTPNWTGAKAVIRKVRWIADICPITNHVTNTIGSTITYTNPPTVNTYPGIAGYGYFIQDDVRTLDAVGEWFLNKTTKQLSMYFGSTATQVVKYSQFDTVINVGSFTNITIDGIQVEGSNVYGIYAKNGNNVTVQNCVLNNNGGTGIYIWNIINTNILNNAITNNYSNGIFVNNQIANFTVIRGNTLNNIGYVVGMGGSGDDINNGIKQNGDNCTIELNSVQNTGYNAIQYQGNNILINKNFINNYCKVFDDGGGIYSWANNGAATYSNRQITNNIIVNGIGAGAGTNNPTSNESRSIYCDGGTNNVYFFNNTCISSSAGAFLNNSVNITLRKNTFFNVPIGISMQRFNDPPAKQFRTTDIKDNVFYNSQSNLFYWNARLDSPAITIQNDIRAIGIIDSNSYKSDIPAQFDWYYHQNASATPDGFTDPPSMNLTQWKTYTLFDANSSSHSGNFQIFYNASNVATTTALSGVWADTRGNNYTSYTLQPYSSIVLKQISLPIVEDNLLILKGVKFY